jgi:acetyltransferase-like isoleucine patch superfamily enzyme
MKVHSLADVQSKTIGIDTVIWQFVVILEGAVIGNSCNVNCHTFIENDVMIGNNVTVKSGVYLWDGIVIEDNVFIGPNATFTNDKYPRSKKYPDSFQKTKLKKGCSIGANATILGGVTIGAYAIIGAGSMVTKDVPAHALVRGNPASVVAWLDEQGNKLVQETEDEFLDANGNKYKLTDGKLSRL